MRAACVEQILGRVWRCGTRRRADEKARKSGAPQAEIDAQTKKTAEFKEMYKNPLVNIAFTFLEPLPVGLLVTLISAGILRRKGPGETADRQSIA
ncbi:MAG: DUF4199 domain-containing protein [Acidobacteriota bacterium]